MTHPLVDPRGTWMRDVLTDAEVVARVLAGENELFELLMRRHNQQLFRTVRAVVRDDSTAEEVLQLAYIAAWRGLARFDGRGSFCTWMTRIALRTAGETRHREQRATEIAQDAWASHAGERETEAVDDATSRRELAAILERAIERLPEIYRVVFVLRFVQGLSTADVAEALDLEENAVKVRVHRARERLQKNLMDLAERSGVLAEAWAFDGERCDRVVAGVFRRAQEDLAR